MTLDQARATIHAADPAPIYTLMAPAKDGKSYVCPYCQNGTGENGDGIHIDPDHGGRFHCFKCGHTGDAVDLYQQITGEADHMAATKAVAELYGITLDAPQAKQTEPAPAGHPAKAAKLDIEAAILRRIEADIQAAAEARKPDNPSHAAYIAYLQTRGISEAVAEAFNLGYLPKWHHPKAPRATPSPRLIVPTSKQSYTARDTRETPPAEAQKFTKQKAGKTPLYNLAALAASTPVFVVEGELDAISFYEVDGEAIALGSTANTGKLLEYVKANPPAAPLILALDNDKAGAEAAAKLAAELDKLKIPYYKPTAPSYAPYKDANAFLVADPDGFAGMVRQTTARAADPEQIKREEAQAEYATKAKHAADILAALADYIANPPPDVSTGFNMLNMALGDGFNAGGLPVGLTTIGAISSLGKTTYALQIADHIAASGRDVLVVALEMTAVELAAKSISRLAPFDVSGFTARAIKHFNDFIAQIQPAFRDEKETVFRRIQAEYAKIAEHLYIVEPHARPTADDVEKLVELHIAATGRAPVLVVDYLQILAPHDERGTDKANADYAISKLKTISRDKQIPVLCISSLNRLNYNETARLEAFKETGAIEYSSDIILGMQLYGAGMKKQGKSLDVDAEKARNPRRIQVVVLKNRDGITGNVIPYHYYPARNKFIEGTQPATFEEWLQDPPTFRADRPDKPEDQEPEADISGIMAQEPATPRKKKPPKSAKNLPKVDD